jgi:POT family proton-dependent oligopeptide transporter
MGINIGAFVCNFVAAYLRNYYGWGYAFAAAGIGMVIGIIWFLSGHKHIKHADILKPTNPEDIPLSKIFLIVFGPLFLFGAIGWFIPGDIFGSDSTDAFILASIPVTIFYISLWIRGSKEDKAPIAALLSIFGVVVIFWAIFHQNATALTIWAESYTDRSMPTVVEPMAQTFGMVQVVDTSPREVPKFDAHGVPLVDVRGNAITETGPHPYFNNLDKSLWSNSEGIVTLKLISTEIFQSVNPFFVVAFTPLVVAFFSLLRRRKLEPSTPAKIGWGMFITAISTLVMIGAVYASQDGLEKSSAAWLIGTYAIITVGELFLSPMGLSLVSKLAPARLTALMMGGWFLATSIGNKLSGVIAGLWDTIALKQYFFLINFTGAMVGALAIFLMVKWLRRVVLEHTGSH